jgi:hypothetical protein
LAIADAVDVPASTPAAAAASTLPGIPSALGRGLVPYAAVTPSPTAMAVNEAALASEAPCAAVQPTTEAAAPTAFAARPTSLEVMA